MTFASRPTDKKEVVPETDFKMTFAKSNNKTTTSDNGSGLFMNVAKGMSETKSSSTNGLFMNVTQQKRNEKIKDPNIIRYEYKPNNINDDGDNPNIIKIIRF